MERTGNRSGSDLDDVSFPTPRDECLEAVRAAREYIHDHNGATTDEILDGLAPEKHHRIGITGMQLVGKLNEVDRYRSWIWDTVLQPGLAAVPTVDSPAGEDSEWTPVSAEETEGAGGGERNASSIHSTVDVRETVENGVVFELSHSADGDQRHVLVVFEEKVRPSALPIDSPSAYRFRPLTRDDSVQVFLPDIVALEPIGVESIPEPIRNTAVAAIAETVEDKPGGIPQDECEQLLNIVLNDNGDPADGLAIVHAQFQHRADALETCGAPLFTLLEQSDGPEGVQVLEDLQQRSESDPSAVRPYVPNLATLLTNSSDAVGAARCLGTLAEEDPAAVLDVVPQLAVALESADEETHRWLVYAFSLLADEYPEELFPVLDELLDSIAAEEESIQTNALSAVGRIAGSYPEAAEPVIDELVELLSDGDDKTRANATGVLADIAHQYPGQVIEYAPVIARQLDCSVPDARHNASIVLVRAGEADPRAIRNVADHLDAALDADNPEVRANVCTVVGNADVAVSQEKLRELSDGDPDATVRERATWAIERVS